MFVKDQCYWCSNPTVSNEHIPPLGLFPNGHKVDLITVRSCSNHNHDLSKIDERMRFYMTSMGSDTQIGLKHFKEKTIKGLRRIESRGLAIDIINKKIITSDGTSLFKEDSENWDLYFEKIIRGLYFFHFKTQLNSRTHFFSNKLRMLDLSANVHFFYHTIEERMSGKWIEGNPKNKKIFDYKYCLSEVDNQFLVIMKFYVNHQIIGISLPDEKDIDDYSISFEEYKKYMDNI